MGKVIKFPGAVERPEPEEDGKPLPSPREILEDMLGRGETFTALFLDDTQAELLRVVGREVPPAGTVAPVVLSWSYRYRPGDLVVDEDGIRETLSFDRAPEGFLADIPWAQVVAAWSSESDYMATFKDGRTVTIRPAHSPEEEDDE